MNIMKSIFFVFFIIISSLSYSQVLDSKKKEEYITAQYDSILIKGGNASGTHIIKVQEYIRQSEQINFKKGMLRGLSILQKLMIQQGSYELAEKYGKEAEKLADEQGDNYTLGVVNIYRATIAMRLGMYPEADKALKKASESGEKIENKTERYIYLSSLYSAFATMQAGMGNNDSVGKYIKKSLTAIEKAPAPIEQLTESQKIRYYYMYIFALMNMGNVYTENVNKPQLDLAESYFQKALSYSVTQPTYFKMCDVAVYSSVSSFYLQKKDYEKCILYSQKVLELGKVRKDTNERLAAYQKIKEAYGFLRNNKNEYKYLKLYAALKDSIDQLELKTIINQSRTRINESKNEYHKDKRNISFTFIGIVLLITGGSWYYVIQRKRRYSEEYNQLISKLSKESSEEHNTEKKITMSNNIIYSETEKKLLKKLKSFEDSDKFLKSEMSLNYLASQFKTNVSYLSQIVNNHKSQNFNNYINSLRINYITNKLYNEKKYREYKISYLAQECGYASSQVFVNAFKNEHGIPPSYFIKNLKNSEK